MAHPDVTEILSRLGFDWLLLDAEHGSLEPETLKHLMQAMNGSGCVPIVRPPWNDPVLIKRILDVGAYGVLVPWVSNKAAAEAAVRACRYPPEGIRGYGPRRAGRFDPDYYQTANDAIMVIVQIETAEAVDNLDDILAVNGVDGCYIGPYDLSSNLGLGLPPPWDNPEYLAVFDRVVKAAARHGKPAGMYASVDNIEWAQERGFRLNTVGGADKFLITGARAALAKAGRKD
jgi:2-keto-3-deoxy-L-rhamnonate aldolase RhmA